MEMNAELYASGALVTGNYVCMYVCMYVCEGRARIRPAFALATFYTY
jgi:hypothetical protein